MTANDILNDLSIQRNKYTLLHASKLLALYNLVKTLKNDIVSIEQVDSICTFAQNTEIKTDFGGKRTEYISNNGYNLPAKNFTIFTKNGEYKICCPTNCNIYTMFCAILNISSIEQEKEQIIETIEVSSKVIEKIKIASLYVADKNEFRWDSLKNVLLDFSENCVNVVASDAHRLYVSENLPTNGINKKLIICPESMHFIKKIKTKNEFIKIEIIDANNALFEGVKIKLYTVYEFINYKLCMPTYLEGMIFDRVKILDSITNIANIVKPENNQISMYLNGNIKISAIDTYSTHATIEANYEVKTFDDMNIKFNSDFVKTCLKSFKCEQLEMRSNGDKTRAVIFTDSKDIALLMPIL